MKWSSLPGCHGAGRVTQHAPAASIKFKEKTMQQLTGLLSQAVLPTPFFPCTVSARMTRLEVISGDQLHHKSSLRCPTFGES